MYDKLIKLYPDNQEEYLNKKGENYFYEIGLCQTEGIANFNKAIELNPHDCEAFFN